MAAGDWVGEDALFNESVNYTVVAKSDVVVLEFHIDDLKRAVGSEYLDYFNKLSV